tara:strand:+ start:1207 stop:1755 length:549 start_codon:yes stop_codon:yes gene_type:complete
MSFKLKNTEDFLTNYSKRLITLIQKQIDTPITRSYNSGRVINSELNASGRLKQSLSLEKKIIRGGDFFSFAIKGNDYAERIDEGTKAGTNVKVNDIVSWINAKPVTLDSINNKNRVANLIAQKINREGIRPVPFLTNIVATRTEDIVEVTPKVLEDISNNLDDFMQMIGYIKQGKTFKLLEQ